MINLLYIDTETRSYKELRGQTSVGLDNYVKDPSTECIIVPWAVNDGEPQVWFPLWQPMPPDLRLAFLVKPHLVAYNSAFDRGILKYCLGIDIPISRWEDPQPSARYLSLPGSLDEVGEILRLPPEFQKNKEGRNLINIFTKPTKNKKTKELYFRDWDSDPEDWAKFVEYAKQDIRAEREILKRLQNVGCYPLPLTERKIWELDQKINNRGIPVDRPFVQSMFNLGERAKKDAIGELQRLTGLDNANSNSQMLAWAQKQGYSKQSLEKGIVVSELKFNDKLTPLCREVLELRKAASSTSYKKMAAILRLVSPDNRLRNQFVYMGSPRCGRWAGNGYQFQNQARPSKEFENPEVLEEARDLIKVEDYHGIIKRFGKDEKDFGSVLSTVKSCIRSSFQAEPGKVLNVCDLNAIETRTGGWMAGCQSLIQVFLDGKDPYLSFAVDISGQIYEKLARDIKSKDEKVKATAKEIRQWAKAGVLQCIYRASGGELRKNKKGEIIKTGLWGFAVDKMGLEMSQEKAAEIVRVFRNSYPEIVQFWFDAEDAVFDVLKGQRIKRQLGPDGCIKIDKIDNGVYPILRVQLPSERYIHYFDARIEDCLMPWKTQDSKGEYTVDVWKPGLVYANVDQETKQWGTAVSHGGKLMENWDQGISRDVLAHYLMTYENSGLPVCLHVHDEGGSETVGDRHKEMEAIMQQPIGWAPNLPLAGEGWSGPYYKKG